MVMAIPEFHHDVWMFVSLFVSTPTRFFSLQQPTHQTLDLRIWQECIWVTSRLTLKVMSQVKGEKVGVRDTDLQKRKEGCSNPVTNSWLCSVAINYPQIHDQAALANINFRLQMLCILYMPKTSFWVNSSHNVPQYLIIETSLYPHRENNQNI